MELINYTPFPELCFEQADKRDSLFGVLVARGTFQLIDGQALRPIPEQDPVQLSDVYLDEPGESSVVMATDLAPMKPRTDIHIRAKAHAPGGQPAKSWEVEARVGRLERKLQILGPHHFFHSLTGWWASKPAACRQVALAYERAYGGSCGEGKERVAHQGNPLGAGFIDHKRTPRNLPLLAPQIIAVGEKVRPGKPNAVKGMLPIANGWTPRRKLAGTFDKSWRDTRWPLLPRDFDYAFYNDAHPDFIYPGYLDGSERIILRNLTAHREIVRYELPRYTMFVAMHLTGGAVLLGQSNLDTLHLDVSAADPEQHRAHLSWRFTFPLPDELKTVELRLEHPDQNATGASLGHP